MRPIFIVGYMGSGKSTVGRKLADKLGLRFVDTDFFLENRFRQRVCDMFATIGEEGFRRRERVIIEELSGLEDSVIATGGGLPCYYDNMDLLLASGITLYLSAQDQTLARRLELCKRTRPTIKDKTGDELLEHIREAMFIRRPIYERAQHHESIDALWGDADEYTLVDKIALYIGE